MTMDTENDDESPLSPTSPGQRLFDESFSPRDSDDRVASPIAPPFRRSDARSLLERNASAQKASSSSSLTAARFVRPKSIAPLNMDLVMGKRRGRRAAQQMKKTQQKRQKSSPSALRVVTGLGLRSAVPMDSDSDGGEDSPQDSMSYRFSESGTFETRSTASSVRGARGQPRTRAGVVMVVRENGIVPLAVGRPFGNTPSWSRGSTSAAQGASVSVGAGSSARAASSGSRSVRPALTLPPPTHWSARLVSRRRARGSSIDALDPSTRLEPVARHRRSSREGGAAEKQAATAAAMHPLMRTFGALGIHSAGQPPLPLAPVRRAPSAASSAPRASPEQEGNRPANSDSAAAAGAGAATAAGASNVHRHHFLALDRLGRGASAVVSKALHVPSLTIVAVKVVRIFHDTKRRQFERELHALRSSAMIAPMGLVQPWSESERDALMLETRQQPLVSDMETTPSARAGKRPRLPSSAAGAASASASASTSASASASVSTAAAASPWRLPVPCPHIVACHGAFTDAKRATLSIVLEYMDAGSLQDLVDAGLVVPESSLANIAQRLCLALLWIHGRRQLHRDIKPSNLLIDSRGAVKLSDFGISRELDGDDGHTLQAKTFVGTLLYMSPERLTTDQAYGPAADIWALGMSLRTLATGSHPFAGMSYWKLVEALRDEETYVKLAQLEPFASQKMVHPRPATESSAMLRHFVKLCLTRDPAERPSAADLMQHPFLQCAKRAAPSATSAAQQLVAGAAEAELDGIIALLAKRLARHLAQCYRLHRRDAKISGAAQQQRPFRCDPRDPTRGLCAVSRTAALAEQLQLPLLLVRRKFDAMVTAAYAKLKGGGRRGGEGREIERGGAGEASKQLETMPRKRPR